jgi:hypothetical protein
MVIFAAVLLAVIGFFNLLDGIAATGNSHVFIGNAHYVVGDLRAWGWVMTIFGLCQVRRSLAKARYTGAKQACTPAVPALPAPGSASGDTPGRTPGHTPPGRATNPAHASDSGCGGSWSEVAVS